MTETYRVQLDAFEGPLDLLLYLIRKHEVEIHDIPIAPIADDFLDHLGHLERVDIDQAGEFLVMAATLMEIKSRWLDRRGDPDVSDEEAPDPADEDRADPRAELVRQLLEYKRHRDAADVLAERRDAWSRRFANAPAGVDADRIGRAMEDLGELEIEDIDLHDLVEAFQAIVSSVNFDRLGEHEVVADDTPIELHEADILDRLRREGEAGTPEPGLTLPRLFAGRSRGEMVGLFLALLTLVRDQRIGLRPHEGQIAVTLRDAEPESEAETHPEHS